MKFETLKSIILIFLIATSLVLTFGMWNYQPSVESLSDAKPEDISLNGSEETIRTLVEPKQIIFHHRNQHFSFQDPLEQRNFYQQLQNWILNDFETARAETPIQNYDVEVVFPTPLPMEMVDSLFSLDTSSEIELPIWSFQHMYITLDKEMDALRVEFLSIDKREKAVAVIQDRSSYEKYLTLVDEQELKRLVVVEIENGKKLYLPEGEIELPRKTVTFSQINANDLVEVLFSDPSIVRQSNYSNRGATYFTDSSQMSVAVDDSTMEYISPGAINDYPDPLYAEDLLNKSISNINAYKGWTDTYKLTYMNSNENYIRYQMFFEGYPVFSPLTKIEQRWGKRLIEYNRPLFRSNNSLNESLVVLKASQVVLDYVEGNYNMEDIEDIQVGYNLKYEKDKNIIIFEPSWFFKQKFSRHWIPFQP